MQYGTLEEKKTLQRKSGYFAGGAILFAILSAFVIPAIVSSQGNQSDLFTGAVLITQLVTVILWVIGCAFYARSKGWSGFMGILGILTIIGLIVLVVLPDKWKKALKEAPVGPKGTSDLTNYPR